MLKLIIANDESNTKKGPKDLFINSIVEDFHVKILYFLFFKYFLQIIYFLFFLVGLLLKSHQNKNKV